MIIVNDIKSLPRHSIYISSYIVGLTNTDRYSLRKRDIERSETGAKPWSGKAGGEIMASTERKRIMRFGAVLPVGSRGKAPGGDSLPKSRQLQGPKLPEADDILAIKTRLFLLLNLDNLSLMLSTR